MAPGLPLSQNNCTTLSIKVVQGTRTIFLLGFSCMAKPAARLLDLRYPDRPQLVLGAVVPSFKWS